MKAQAQPPKGVVITIDPNGSNLYWSTLIGRPFTLANLLALQAACRDFARLLEGEVRATIKRMDEI
jgi:hypothetical protein